MLRIRVPPTGPGTAFVYAYLRPDSDVSAGSWTDQANGTTNLYSVIDETTASDTDYVKSSTMSAGSSDTLEVSLSDATDPALSTGHRVSYRYRSQGTASMTLTVSLREGASTEIASWTHTNVGTSYVDAVQTLSVGETDSITDYTALRLRFVATAV